MALNMRHRGVLVSWVVVLALGLAACGSDDPEAEVADGSWDDVVAAAEKEGSVNIYTIAPPLQNERLEDAFEKMYPDIDAKFTLGSAELYERAEQEIQAGTDAGDVYLFANRAFFLGKGDKLMDLTGPNAEAWPTDWWIEQDKSIVPLRYPWTVFMWNTNIFPDGIDDWDDFIAPAAKNRVGYLDLVSPSMVETTDWMVETLGEDYFKSLGEQSPKGYNSAITMGQAIASGEVGAAYLSTPSIGKDLKESGAPIDYTTDLPTGGFALEWTAGAPANAGRPNAALVFTDFLMSPEGQEAVAGDGLGASALPGVPGALDLEGWELVDTASVTPERTADYEALLSKYFGS